MSNLSLEIGLTITTDPSVPKEDIPDRVRDCEQWTLENDPAMVTVYLRSPVNNKFETWRAKGQEDGVVADRFGFSVRRTWITRGDGKEFDVLSIIAICDWVSLVSASFKFLRCV
jgi:hypothetical protein